MLFSIQGDVNMIYEMVKEGKCFLPLNSYVGLLCFICCRSLLAMEEGAFKLWRHLVYYQLLMCGV